MTVSLRELEPGNLAELLPWVGRCHAFEGITQSDTDRAEVVATLLKDVSLGRIWMIEKAGQAVGYLAVCFSFSIEFGGREATIDEFFVAESVRAQGIGSLALDQVATVLAGQGFRVLTLEADREGKGPRFYERHGFRQRERYTLMTRVL